MSAFIFLFKLNFLLVAIHKLCKQKMGRGSRHHPLPPFYSMSALPIVPLPPLSTNDSNRPPPPFAQSFLSAYGKFHPGRELTHM